MLERTNHKKCFWSDAGKYLCVWSAVILLLSGCGIQAKVSGAAENTDGQAGAAAQETQAGKAPWKNQESPDDQEAVKELFAMDTYMTLAAYGDRAREAVDAAAVEIQRLEGLLSTGDSESELSKVNREGRGTLSKDTAALTERSLELYQETKGIFNIAVYPVMRAWGFTDGSYRVPSQEELTQLLSLTNARKIKFDRDLAQISFGREGMEIDLGGIAKGYTSNRIMEIFREYGVKSGLVNLGGNVQALGTKTDGSLWRVSILHPENTERYAGILSIEDCAVVTSGGYERCFEKDGTTYHHIIDPRTGYPADSGLESVTIVSPDGTLADGLSTSFFVMGLEKASAYWREHQEEFEMVLMSKEGGLYVTKGIAEHFTSDYEITVIEGK